MFCKMGIFHNHSGFPSESDDEEGITEEECNQRMLDQWLPMHEYAAQRQRFGAEQPVEAADFSGQAPRPRALDPRNVLPLPLPQRLGGGRGS